MVAAVLMPEYLRVNPEELKVECNVSLSNMIDELFLNLQEIIEEFCSLLFLWRSKHLDWARA
jgi:hypothetical protein